jgi:PAS domain S-box-containing protein
MLIDTGTSVRAETLKAYERSFCDLFDAVPIIAIILDKQGNLVFCNEHLLRITGWRREEILDRNWCDLFVPRAQYPRDVYTAQLASSRIPSVHENDILTKGRSRRFISWYKMILFDEGHRPVWTASLGQDITERKQAEQGMRNANETVAIPSGMSR